MNKMYVISQGKKFFNGFKTYSGELQPTWSENGCVFYYEDDLDQIVEELKSFDVIDFSVKSVSLLNKFSVLDV